MDVKRLRRKVYFCLFRVGALPFELLPLGVARVAGSGLGLVVWLCVRPLRRRAVENLLSSLGEGPGLVTGTPAGGPVRDRAWGGRVVRKMFVHLGRIVGELLYFSRRSPARVDGLISSVVGVEVLEKLVSQGRGGVVVTPHIGNFELLATWLFRQVDGVAIEKRSKGSAFTDYTRRRRERLGMTTINQESSPRPLLRILREGRFVGLLPDQDMDQLPGVFIPFFGRDAYTVTAPASMARLAKVPLLPVSILWKSDGYEIRFSKPIEVSRTDDKEDDVKVGTLAWTRVFEDVIREHPDQWVWIHERWRTTPEGLVKKRGRRQERKERALARQGVARPKDAPFSSSRT